MSNNGSCVAVAWANFLWRDSSLLLHSQSFVNSTFRILEEPSSLSLFPQGSWPKTSPFWAWIAVVAAHWAFCLFSKDQWFCWDLSHKLSLQFSETSSRAITFTSATLASTSSLKLAWHFLTLEHVHPVPLSLNQFSRLRPFVLSELHTWAHVHVHTQNPHYLSSCPIRNSTKGTTHTHTHLEFQVLTPWFSQQLVLHKYLLWWFCSLYVTRF